MIRRRRGPLTFLHALVRRTSRLSSVLQQILYKFFRDFVFRSETVSLMKQQALFSLALAVFGLGLSACNKPAASENKRATPAAKEQDSPTANAKAAAAPAPNVTPAPKSTVSSTNVLIFRNIRS